MPEYDDDIDYLDDEQESDIAQSGNKKSSTKHNNKNSYNNSESGEKPSDKLDNFGSNILQKMGVPRPLADKTVKNNGGRFSPNNLPASKLISKKSRDALDNGIGSDSKLGKAFRKNSLSNNKLSDNSSKDNLENEEKGNNKQVEKQKSSNDKNTKGNNNEDNKNNKDSSSNSNSNESNEKSGVASKLFGGKSFNNKLKFIVVIVACSFLLLLIILFAISGAYDSTVGKVEKILAQIEGFFSTDSSNPLKVDEFVSKVKKVKQDYLNDDKEINVLAIVSFFAVVEMENENFQFNQVSEEEIRQVADSMLLDGKYDKATFEEKMIDLLRGYLVSPSDPYAARDMVFTYIDNFKEAFPDYKQNNDIFYATNELYWWPIGSSEILENNGKKMATGEPETVNITSPYGDRTMDGKKVFHNGIDISNGSQAGTVNIIAANSGEVIYPTDNDKIDYGVGYYGSKDGGGYGNYVKIKHSDGTITVYGHLFANSITVRAGDRVEQGQVIGKMGTSGSSTGVHLHFSVYVGGDTASNAVDPSDYVDPSNPRPAPTGASFSLTSTNLSENEFVAKMQNYYDRTKNNNFLNNFLTKSREIYQASARYGVNPELVVVTASTESAFKGCGTTGNYWGIGIPNGAGCSAGPTFSSMSDGIMEYAATLANYNNNGSYASTIINRYNERKNAGCKPGGYGMPGTLSGMQSIYSWLGDYRFNPGNWGKGGCVYLETIYGSGYCNSVKSCTNYDSCPKDSKTTICEQSDYTLFQVTEKLKVRQDIFGL